MISLDFRPSSRLIRLIGKTERFAGRWERLALAPAFASEELKSAALYSGTRAAFDLDSTSPVGISFLLSAAANDEGLNLSHNPAFSGASAQFQSLLSAHQNSSDWSLSAVLEFYRQVVEQHDVASETALRNKATYFFAPAINPLSALSGITSGSLSAKDEMVFHTVSPFLVRRRIEDLLLWLDEELDSESAHPLITIGCFYLMFLQIHPFATANHRVGLVLLHKLLNENGYDFTAFEPLACQFAARPQQYFQALRQAEKTAGSTWATLNIWLEFFVESLLGSAVQLVQRSERRAQHAGLTPVQKQIVEIVKNHGKVSRETIVTETGINLSTVKYNLSVLAERGHLTREGGGRSTSYRAI